MLFPAPAACNRGLRIGVQKLRGEVDPTGLQYAIPIDELNVLNSWETPSDFVETGVPPSCGRVRSAVVERDRYCSKGSSEFNTAIGRTGIHVDDLCRRREQRPQAKMKAVALIAAYDGEADA